MKSLIVAGLLLVGFGSARLEAQGRTAAALSPPPKLRPQSAEKDPLKAAVSAKGQPESKGPIITEIYADAAFFDSAKHIGTFTGHVIVKDPRFNVQAEKLTVYLNKGDAKPAAPPPSEQPQGFEKAVAEGNVGLVREVPGENGAPPTRSVGRAEVATYTTSDGNVELKGNPRVQSGTNTHIATSPDTVMVITQSGQLTTNGPSRTDIRQEPSPSPAPSDTVKP